jgi:hypothetical protein
MDAKSFYIAGAAALLVPLTAAQEVLPKPASRFGAKRFDVAMDNGSPGRRKRRRH